MNGHTLLAFGTYTLVTVVVALLAYRRSRNTTDYLLGGRSLNFYVTALSAHASDMSTWLFMAYPAMVLLTGGSGAWAAVGLLAGMWANWHFIAPRLRTETERTGSLTLSHYFSKRFGDQSGVLRTLGAGASLLFFTVYLAGGLVGIGFLLHAVAGLSPMVGMGIGLALVMLYTLVGGYRSVCWVDLFQALFLLVMIILVPIVALMHVGGISAVQAAAHAKELSLSLFPKGGLRDISVALLLSLGWGLGYFGQTHILSKFMGINDAKELKKSKRVGLTWQLLCLLAATLVGLVGIAYLKGDIANPELVFIHLVQGLFHPFMAGLILCGIVAAAISTMDSQLLVTVPVLSEDLYHRFMRRNPSTREQLWSSRISLLVLSVLAFAIAAFSGQSVLGLVYYSWAGLGSTFGPVLVMALYSKQVNSAGAITGMLFGGLVALTWPHISQLLPVQIPTLVPGFLLNLGVIYTVSRLTSPRTATA